MAKLRSCLLLVHFVSIVISSSIELLECEPPNYPQWGGYGPRQDFYIPGDVIHYYCDTDTHIGGNFYRVCEDTGDWSGDTPVCDAPATFPSVNQTSTVEPVEENAAENAVDGLRTTCSSTRAEQGSSWIGILENPGQLIRVMIFLPKVDVSYEVFMIKANGDEMSCGSKTAKIDRYKWEFHNCPEPHNTGVVGVKIKSMSAAPLQLCEVAPYVLTDPTCVDPHVPIENGRLQLNRKFASLVCDAGYTRSPATRLECVRTGVWNRKTLYCLERQWEVENSNPNNPEVVDREPQSVPR
ncbi:hypothetical protein X975_05858, partial [Stegodyphus mimosarum]